MTFLKTIQDPDTAAKKTSVVDILCEDQEGNSYVVEMQVAQHSGFEKRAQYYAAKAYTSQMEKGGRYHNLKEIIFIAIANFVMFPDKKAYKSDHVIFDRNNGQHDLKDFSFTFLELPKFKKEKYQLKTMIEKWAYYFKHADETKQEDLKQVFENDEIILKAYDELDRFHWKDEELRAYEQEIKRDMDNQAVMDFKIEAAERKGLEQGLEKGIAQGEAKGRAEEKQKMAKSLKQEGVTIAVIAKTTGLSIEEIEKL